jgi:phage shock protein A
VGDRGIGRELLGTGRAQDKTEVLTARADALDELMATGAIDALPDGETQLERELAELTTASQVEELAALRKELTA